MDGADEADEEARDGGHDPRAKPIAARGGERERRAGAGKADEEGNPHQMGVEVGEEERPVRELGDIEAAEVDPGAAPPVEGRELRAAEEPAPEAARDPDGAADDGRARGERPLVERLEPFYPLVGGIEVADGDEEEGGEGAGEERFGGAPPDGGNGWGRRAHEAADDGEGSGGSRGGEGRHAQVEGVFGKDAEGAHRHGEVEPPHVVVVEAAAGKPGVVGREDGGADDGREVGDLHRLFAALRMVPEVGIRHAEEEEGGKGEEEDGLGGEPVAPLAAEVVPQGAAAEEADGNAGGENGGKRGPCEAFREVERPQATAIQVKRTTASGPKSFARP
ncbi:hypothetical protein O0235_02730 [Tepidiforma flava]|uniref:Pr1-like protein n=1 Tax=Tepidiforma flava TaxID=3004094 RepID=A0ABY7MAZ9_9CHLR|nr:hypothetical protein [Tepidiforma flava]WBL37590.1 hypothetical protein O0235_02730 [Tepidiforma flava]